jgi:hypothetical protein
MADPAIGTDSTVAVDFENSWGVIKTTTPAPEGRQLSVVSCGISGAQELIDNPSIRGDRNTGDAVFGVRSGSGDLTVVPNVRMLPFFTKLLTGTLVKTGSTDPWTLTSKIGTAAIPSAVIEIDHNIASTHRYIRAIGARINTWTIPFAATGFSQMTIGFQAKNVTVETTAYDSTLTDWRTGPAVGGGPLDSLMLDAADVKIGGSAVTYLVSGEIRVNCNLSSGSVVGSDAAMGWLVPGRYSIDGTLKCVLNAVGVLALSGATSSLSLKWTAGTNRSFQIDLGNVIFQPNTPPLANDGAVFMDLSFRASYDTSDATQLIMTTIQDQEDTYYA